MTVDEIVDELKAEIKRLLGFPVVLLPQAASRNTAHIELQFTDMAKCGDGAEKLVFSATYRTSGTHSAWLSRTVDLRRTLNRIEDSFMMFTAGGRLLRAYWIRNGDAQWIYPGEDEMSMPAEYVVPYRIEIDIPTQLLEE